MWSPRSPRRRAALPGAGRGVRCRSPRLTWSPPTVRMRLGMVRVFFERIIEWGWDDSPARCPVFVSECPESMIPSPSSWTNASTARFMRAAAQLDPLPRLIVAFGRPRERFEPEGRDRCQSCSTPRRVSPRTTWNPVRLPGRAGSTGMGETTAQARSPVSARRREGPCARWPPSGCVSDVPVDDRDERDPPGVQGRLGEAPREGGRVRRGFEVRSPPLVADCPRRVLFQSRRHDACASGPTGSEGTLVVAPGTEARRVCSCLGA